MTRNNQNPTSISEIKYAGCETQSPHYVLFSEKVKNVAAKKYYTLKQNNGNVNKAEWAGKLILCCSRVYNEQQWRAMKTNYGHVLFFVSIFPLLLTSLKLR
jgi:hypothetical protein